MVKNTKQLKLFFSIGVFFLLSVLGSVQVSAANPQDPSKFAFKVLFPENQIDKNAGYYDLKMEPGQEQTVQIEFSNVGNANTSIKVALNSAKTNSNGVIEYGDSNIKNDASLKFDFKKIVTAPKKVELKAGETKKLDFKIKMPETSFDGIVAGGIQLIQEGQNNLEEKGGSMVLNEYAYVIGMKLRETDTEVKPKLKLNSVKAGQSNYKNTVYVDYSNTKANFVENMTTEVQINKKGESAVLYERKQAKMRMAPNSFIAFPVSMNGERMEPGDYTANILVTADGGIKEKWTKDFKITKEDADKFNERDVGLVQDKGFNWKLIIMIVVGFFALVAVIVVVINVVRKNKTKKTSKKTSGKKKSRK